MILVMALPLLRFIFLAFSFADYIGIGGFDFGGQTWDQVFDHAIVPLQALGKPIWILSEGIVPVDNQAQFISDTFAGAKKYSLQGVLYFNARGCDS